MRTILTIILTCVAAVASGQVYRGGEIFRIKDSDVYWAAVKTSYFREYVARQEEDCWCWAACVQMAMRYADVFVCQSDIAERELGDEYNLTASGNEIADGLNGWHGFAVHSYQSKTPQSFIDHISKGNPLIVGIGEHAYLLTHIYYKKASNGMLFPFKTILINPKFGKEEVKDWNDFYSNLNTIVCLHQ